MRNKMLVSADGATVSVQDGNAPKHMHPNTNEIQYILEGTGTIWLGDKEVKVKPGDLVVIPKGTAHGGTKPDGRTAQGDRDQDAAAGAGRHQAAELTAAFAPSFRAVDGPTRFANAPDCYRTRRRRRDAPGMTYTYPRPSSASGRQTSSRRSTTVTARSIRMTKADSTNMPANTPATSNTPSACWIR